VAPMLANLLQVTAGICGGDTGVRSGHASPDIRVGTNRYC
jgi:hypothetical protein